MKIKYSKFDFNRKDVVIFLSFLIYLIFFLLFVDSERNILRYIIFLSSVIIFCSIYRFYLVWLWKNKVKIEFFKTFIKVNGIFYSKKLNYNEIKKLTIRKNYLSSYDIVINYDEGINFFRYLCNYFFDKFSIGKNRDKSFVICDVKNIDEILNFLLEKIGYPKKEVYNNFNKYKIHIKYSLFESSYILFFLIFCVLLLLLFIFDKFSIIIIYIFIGNIKFLKKEYNIINYDKDRIEIYEEKRKIYIIRDFYEDNRNIIIDYDVKENLFGKYNFYYFENNMLPRKYKK